MNCLDAGNGTQAGDVGTLDRLRKSVEGFGDSINRSDVDRRLRLRSAVRLASVKNSRKNARSRRSLKLYQHSYVRYFLRYEICRNGTILCRHR